MITRADIIYAGITPPAGNSRIDPEQHARELIIAGQTTRRAAEIAGISYHQGRKIHSYLVMAKLIPPQSGRKIKLNPDQRAQVISRLMSGAPRAVVAAEFGVSATMICGIANKWRNEGGEIPSRIVMDPGMSFFRMGVNMGRISDAFTGLSTDTLTRIAAEIPDGCTVADWLRSVVSDVVADMEGGK